MDLFHTIFGDIREVVPAPFSEFILVIVSIACGTAEDRELADGQRELIIRHCRAHKTHRAFQGDLASLDSIEFMEPRSK